MTTETALANGLLEFGYTELQATFLYMVAVHSGYFLGRQYDEYSGSDRGGTRQRLIEQLTTNKHATALVSRDQNAVFHLCARRFYEAIGASDNRNRRSHAPFVVPTTPQIIFATTSNPKTAWRWFW